MISVTMGRPTSFFGGEKQPDPVLAQALEGIGGGSGLEGAAAEHGGARRP